MFWYCTMADAKLALDCGVPGIQDRDFSGIVFTFTRPLDFANLAESEWSFPKQTREVVLACSVPSRLLFLLPGSSSEVLLTGNALKALRGSYLGSITDRQPWIEGSVFLPPHRIIRAYQLVEALSDEQIASSGPSSNILKVRFFEVALLLFMACSRRLESPQDLDVSRRFSKTRAQSVNSPIKMLTVVNSINVYLSSMDVIRETCSQNGWVPLFHYSSKSAAAGIRKDGFRMSTQGDWS